MISLWKLILNDVHCGYSAFHRTIGESAQKRSRLSIKYMDQARMIDSPEQWSLIVLSSNTSTNRSSLSQRTRDEIWRIGNLQCSSPSYYATPAIFQQKKYMLCLSFVRGRRQFRGVAEARKKKNKVFDAVINSFLNDKHCPFHTEIEVNRRTVKQTNWLSKEFYHFVNRSLLRIFAFISEKNRDRKNRRWHDSTLTDFRRWKICCDQRLRRASQSRCHTLSWWDN